MASFAALRFRITARKSCSTASRAITYAAAKVLPDLGPPITNRLLGGRARTGGGTVQSARVADGGGRKEGEYSAVATAARGGCRNARTRLFQACAGEITSTPCLTV